MKKRAVFLDRDGTINRDVGYPNSYDMVEIFPYSFAAVRKINEAGFLSVIVTNQAGIGKGFIEEKNLQDIHRKLRLDFAKQKAAFDGIYYCPARDLNIDTTKSYMIGDKVEDIHFGMNIKATPILLLTGYGQKALPKLREKGIVPAHVAETLIDAVDWILEREKSKR